MEKTSHKILLIDDDADLLEVYRELLGQLPSRPEIFTTTSGARGMAMLKSEPFRLLICDLKMPKMDGLQVLTIVRRRFPELRTVVLTGVPDEHYRSRAYALGVDMFWLKPDTQQNMEMFLQCIESLLGRDEDAGFRGVQSKSLLDILQMEALSQSSAVLRITRGSLVGCIWLSGGELVDAEAEGARGEQAFRRILEWKSGTFESLPAEPARERTILKSMNALLLETVQAMDETANAPAATGEEETEQAEHPRTVWRLAALTREGADFVVSLAPGAEAQPEGWGTAATEELGGWMKLAAGICQELSLGLECGPLVDIEGRGIDQRVVLLPQAAKTYLVGWPVNKAGEKLAEPSKQLVASWDS
jgi:CheY-like chemotaxis protein